MTENTLPNLVASGDVTQDSAILWTRSTVPGDVVFEYSTDPDFNTIEGTVTATVTDPDIPVKVEVTELDSSTEYYYRVTNAPGATASGEFDTPAMLGENEGIRFGYASCWRGELGPYPAISNIPDRDLDFFMQLGDSIYADFGSDAVLNPDGSRDELVDSLDEYRAKHNETVS
ncbi:MAG: PhoD-like phosphatase N-terminal domain-containing protein, partial [Cyanobacteriota bacterium]|nr:PhoD-like phosphatase N-terminal domain-containing protein [Cyanobacteriota bacterium]